MKNNLDNSIIKQYATEILNKYHRYRSWDICYNAFNSKVETDNLSLHLAFYLASWGMYRGSLKCTYGNCELSDKNKCKEISEDD